ncbi:hypothetical protein [Pedobacter aquatilis]|uniref:hypothetical protein n=1 Tax=Pedobacter aquatilis TaxID=351343 RepID=UPI00292CDE35|nr:hypothetical protein [Pedobacter aquatilis]
MVKFFFLLIFTLRIYNLSAQTVKISGFVRSGNQSLPSAAIQLKNINQEILFYGFSEDNGDYSISGDLDQSIKFFLIASYIGYKRDTLIISRNELLKTNFFQYNFNLTEDKKQLDEIYIKAPPAVEVNNDTTKYNVLRFTSPEDRNLESVIKKMPGMDVNKDGTIFFKGKKISKVLLEGDDLTGEGYKAITKNLKPEFVEEIQALEHYVEDDLLKGIINSDDIVLNLKVRNKRARKIVGSVDGGLGTNDSRQLSANLISFIDKTKTFAFANHNNLNSESNSNILDLVDENRKFTGNNQIIKHEIDTYNPFDDKMYSLSNTTQGSLNAITRLSDKFKINYSLFYSWSKLMGQTSIENIYFTPNNTYTKNSDNRTSVDKIFKADFSADYLIKNNARFVSKFTYKQEPKNFNIAAFSIYNNIAGDSVSQNQQDLNRTFNGLLKYTIKANKRTAYLFSARILADGVNQDYLVNSNLYENMPIFIGSNSLLQEVDNRNFKLKIDAEALKRYDTSFLYFNLGNEINHFRINSNLFSANQRSIGGDYVNNNLFKMNQTYLTAKYVYDNQPVKIIAQLKSTLQFLKNMGKDSTYYTFEPNITFSYRPGQVQHISLTYNYRNNNPQPIEYYKNYILTDIRNFSSGLTNFYNYNMHSVNLDYGFNDFANSYFNLNVSVNGNYSKYGFLYTNFFNNTLNYSEKQPYKGIRALSSNINAKKFIPFLSMSLTVTYAPSITNYYSQFGNGARKYTALSQSLGAKINTGFNLPINFGLGTDLLLNRTKSEGNSIAKSNAYKYSFEYRYKISPKIFNYSSFNIYRMNNQNFNLIDTEFQYNPVKGNFKYSLQGKNLANLKAFSNLNINEVSSTNYSSSILGRYFMLNVSMSVK